MNRNDEILILLYEGLSYQEIADRYEITRSRVGQIANENNYRRANWKGRPQAVIDLSHKIFDYIVEYKKQNDGIAPSYAEVSDFTGVNCINQIRRAYNYLIMENKIKPLRTDQQDRYGRTVQIVGGLWSYYGKYIE